MCTNGEVCDTGVCECNEVVCDSGEVCDAGTQCECGATGDTCPGNLDCVGGDCECGLTGAACAANETCNGTSCFCGAEPACTDGEVCASDGEGGFECQCGGVACPANESCVSDSCECGTSEETCWGGQTCKDNGAGGFQCECGESDIACTASETCCDQTCADLTNDTNFCGSCSVDCEDQLNSGYVEPENTQMNAACISSVCYIECEDDPAAGDLDWRERLTRVADADCGGTGLAANINTCDSNFADCELFAYSHPYVADSDAEGCESNLDTGIDLGTDAFTSHCGQCDYLCDQSQACASGACSCGGNEDRCDDVGADIAPGFGGYCCTAGDVCVVRDTTNCESCDADSGTGACIANETCDNTTDPGVCECDGVACLGADYTCDGNDCLCDGVVCNDPATCTTGGTVCDCDGETCLGTGDIVCDGSDCLCDGSACNSPFECNDDGGDECQCGGVACNPDNNDCILGVCTPD